MSWISLVCLLALTSSTFARSAYGGYGSVPLPVPTIPRIIPMVNSYETPKVLTTPPPPPPPPVLSYGSQEKIIPKVFSSYGSQMITPPVVRTLEPVATPSYGSYGSSYGSAAAPRVFPEINVLPPTQAETFCRGAEAGTVIPIEGNRKFIVCIGDDKGYEQDCPKGLFYHPESRRCERKLGPLENACISQPCLNGGQCLPDGSSFRCQCAPGFDGRTCELDARICQTQFPCGQSPDARCQSFRLGAALSYVCIFQEGLSYGLSQQQSFSNPCSGIDGPQRLAFGNKGFILCDGERLFVESCPGGTIWDDFNKACAWPDQEGVISGPMFDQEKDKYSYGGGSERTFKTESYESYSQPMPAPVLPKIIEKPTGYGAPLMPKFLEESTSYGSSYSAPPPPPPPTPKIIETPTYGSYSPPPPPPTPAPRVLDVPTYGSYSAPPPPPPPTPKVFETSNYGSYSPPPPPPPPTPKIIETPTYGSYSPPPPPPTPAPRVLDVPSYGSYSAPAPMVPKVLERHTGYGMSHAPRFIHPEPMKIREQSGY